MTRAEKRLLQSTAAFTIMALTAVVIFAYELSVGTTPHRSMYAPASDPTLTGPCTSAHRLAPDKAYFDLALHLVYDKLQHFDPGSATEALVNEQLARIETLRHEWATALVDECLRAHVYDWLDYYQRAAGKALEERAKFTPYRSEYDRERALEVDQRRALAKALGINP